MPILNKTCSKCKLEKPLSEFYKKEGGKFGVMHACKECIKKYRRTFYSNHREHVNQVNKKHYKTEKAKQSRDKRRATKKYKQARRKYWLKAKYNISPDVYKQLLEKQNGKCAICNQKETVSNQFCIMQLAVDHDHKTGKIRGLLCKNCNQAIGLLNERIDYLENAKQYLLNAVEGSCFIFYKENLNDTKIYR